MPPQNAPPQADRPPLRRRSRGGRPAPGADAPELLGTELRRAAMDLLARREHSRKELHDKLSRRFGPSGVPGGGDSAADNAGENAEDNAECKTQDNRLDIELERLAAEGLQSDQRFAESFVRSRLQRRQGPLRVRQEMRLRGLDPALIDNALQTVDAEQWRTAAYEAAAGRFGFQPPSDRREWSRRARFLQGRGFQSDQIHAVLAEFD